MLNSMKICQFYWGPIVPSWKMSFSVIKKIPIGSVVTLSIGKLAYISRPLSEPGVLKKKFDEIFSATKYFILASFEAA